MAETKEKKLLLIIPAYNEEECIVQVVENLRKYPYDYIVVNDGSTDNTGKVCAENGIPCLQLPFNMGLSGAFQTGILYAHARGYDCAMQFDADGQHLPEYIAPMLEGMEKTGSSIIVGSRNMEGMPSGSLRSIGMRLIRAMIRLTTGKTLTDPTSGMRMYDREMIALYANNINFSPEPDTLAYLMKNGVSVSEVPVQMHERIGGESYLKSWSTVRYMCKMILSILLIQFVRPKLQRKEKEACL